MKRALLPTAPFVDGPAVGAVLLVAVLDVALGAETKFLALYAVGPAFAATRATAVAVVGTGVLAAALAAQMAYHYDILDSRRAVLSLVCIVLVTAFATLSAHARTRQERRLADVRDIAQAAQAAIVPPIPATEGPVRMAASYASAAQAARIGGDVYEAVPIRDGVRILIGDVQGKGLQAVGAAASVVGAFRESAPVADELETVGLRMACALARREDDDRFVTAVLAEVTDKGRVTLLNYGHPSPLLVHERGGVTWADPDQPGMPLGLSTLAECRPGRYQCTLATGDRILFHTDGLTEARDKAGRFYPLAARSGLLRTGSVATSLERLRADARHHAGPDAPDDSALLLMEYHAPRTALSRPSESLRARTFDLGCDVCAVPDCPIEPTLHRSENMTARADGM